MTIIKKPYIESFRPLNVVLFFNFKQVGQWPTSWEKKLFCNFRVNQNKSDENESIDEGGQVDEIVKGDSKGETGAPERKFNSNWIKNMHGRGYTWR